MMKSSRRSLGVVLLLVALAIPALCPAGNDRADALLPAGVKPVWDLDKATREATPTRERICVNGLWRWQPSEKARVPLAVPDGGWGYFKVPGCWPGITDYLQEDCQTVYPNPAWKDTKLGSITSAWYQREIDVPGEWAGRRITLSLDYLNSFATVFVDGKNAGEARFPAGEVDLTAACRPGHKHELSVLVVALPLGGVRLSYTDSAAAREVKGAVARRGLCGDVYLIGSPIRPAIDAVSVETSLRRSEISISTSLQGIEPNKQYAVHAQVTERGKHVKEFTSSPFTAADLAAGRFSFARHWKPDRLWDLNTPENQYDLQVSLVDADGKALDASWAARFGFRELWIEGRDFYLNGSRVFLCAVPFDNTSIGAAWANYGAARETFERLKSIGINFVYTHNYDCEPGSHLSLEEVLRAADDVGMLVALTQPHFSAYDWKAADADRNNGYAHDAAFYSRVAGDHPSVVFYSMSHNATGYDEDMNPDLIDGLRDVRDSWSVNNAKLALRAEAIVHRLDPSRIVYHHAGGNIGSMHTANFYPNFAPVQELCDWFGHWAGAGVKPLFLCEYGAPFTWDWTMYRGWYKGKREFGSAAVPWQFSVAEWDAQFLGDRAFVLSDLEKANLRWEAKQYQAGKVWNRWDYPTQVGSPSFEDRNEVAAEYLTDNWRAYRTWGVSGISPWEYDFYWTARPGVDRGRKALKVDWDNLQRPGLSADYIDHRPERIDVAFERADWIPTATGTALLRNNQPVLAYIAGKADSFTSKGHNFFPGETVDKQWVVINNSRRAITFQCTGLLEGGLEPGGSRLKLNSGSKEVRIETGQQTRIPLQFELPTALAAGEYKLKATAKFTDATGQAQERADQFAVHVLPASMPLKNPSSVSLFDPAGETAKLLNKLAVPYRRIDAGAELTSADTLVVGRFALTEEGPAPDIARVRDGLKVIVFEQASQVLEKRLGFRVVEYGLRRVFERIPDHPLLNGIASEYLRDWQGAATTVPPELTYESRPQHGPTIRWCDIPVSRVWRCGNRGCVASVLIEKPARGDFRPILDGGFGLQYSPLLEYREGKGMVLFCQMDVTARTEADPAAVTLAANLFRYSTAFKPDPLRRAVYVGDPAGREHLKATGIDAANYAGEKLSATEQVLVLGPGGGRELSSHSATIAAFLKDGGHLLGLAVEPQDADAILPFKVSLTKGEHLCAMFDPPGNGSPLAGVGPADLECREPRDVSLVSGGAKAIGDGILGLSPAGVGASNVVLFQLAPWELDYRQDDNLKRSYRRASFVLTRLAANMGIAGATPLLERFHGAVGLAPPEKRWLEGLYLDTPEEWDYPYRFFRW